MDPDYKPIRLILQVVKRSKSWVSFVIAHQTLRNYDFYESLPGDLQARADMDEDDYAAMDHVWLCSENVPAWENGHDTLYVRGDTEDQDYNVMRANLKDWEKIKRSIMMYNREFSKNTLTMEDVIWEI